MSNEATLYENFRGRRPARFGTTGVKLGSTWITAPGDTNLLIPEKLAIIGHFTRLEYTTTRDGQATVAEHVFHPGSRPLLGAGAARGQVFLIGDRYRFTERGIVDIGPDGRLLEK